MRLFEGLREFREGRTVPERDTALFQLVDQRREIGKAWHGLPQSVPGILHVLLDLTLLPARGRIAERWLKHVVVRHRKEAHVDLSFFPAPRNAAEDAEPVPMGIEQHLVGLQKIGPDQKGPAVRQLDVGNLQLGALAT